MAHEINLIEDNIRKSLFRMAIPLMGISFIQMAYSLTDILWLGRLSTNAVAAVGTCSFFVWIANAMTLIAKTGVSVGLSQSYGKGDQEEAKEVMKSGVQVNLVICLLLTGILFFFREGIIGFYSLPFDVHKMATGYLKIVALGMIFTFMNPVIGATFYSSGNSVTPFKVALISLILNIVLDPILIFGIGPIPPMGVEGAAIATVFAQAVGTVVYLLICKRYQTIVFQVNYFKSISKKHVKDILQLGVPACVQSSVHAIVGMVLNKYIANFGPKPIAVYSIGSQIESISWMSAEGFATAISAFTGQNYGAKKFERIEKGYYTGIRIVGSIGLLAAFILFFGNEHLFQLFLPKDPEAIAMGGEYLKILSVSQLFMSIEIGTSGAMNGLSLTRYPAIIGTIFNVARIPMALLFIPIFAVNGIWLSMSLSSVLKGIFAYFCFFLLNKKTKGFRENMAKYVSRI